MATILLALALATAVPPQAAVSAKPLTPVQQRMLRAHNEERLRVRHRPLIWSAKLSADAQRWAHKLARSDRFEHAAGADNSADDGENLWMGTKNAFPVEQMVDAWVRERRLFKPGIFPDISTNGNWEDVGHYTQLIWHSTTAVGCAIGSSPTYDYLVCRYNPAGNWIDENPLKPR